MLTIIFWVANGFALYLSVQADLFGYWAMKKTKISIFTLFFVFRLISEATKIFIAIQFWRQQTILFQPLDEIDSGFFDTDIG